MKKNMMILSIFFIGIIFLTGCSNSLNNPKIQERLIAANSDLQSYSLESKATINMTAKILGKETSVRTDAESKGDIDRVNRRMALKNTVKSDMLGMRTEMDTETYVIDNQIYTKTMNMWLKMDMEQDLWEQQDQISQIIALVESGTIERMDDETIDKEAYYVVKMNPDLKKVVEMALEQQQLELSDKDIDFSEIIKGYSSTIWINKKTFVIEKSRTEMRMIMTPENLGMNETEDSGEIIMDSSIEIRMTNINKEVIINIPEEAKDAIDLTGSKEDLDQGQVEGMDSITGNMISEAFN